MSKRISVIEESASGRNRRFHDNRTGADMNRPKFVQKIEQGSYPGYHIRNINGLATPVSNPNRSERDNLG